MVAALGREIQLGCDLRLRAMPEFIRRHSKYIIGNILPALPPPDFMSNPDSVNRRSGRVSAYVGAPVERFLRASGDTLLGQLAAASAFPIDPTQRDAWTLSIDILQKALVGLTGHLYLEFDVPRLGSRIDAVLVTGGAVFPIEFKVGQSVHLTADINQAWDYGLDLKNFHRASHDVLILPVLVATEAAAAPVRWAPAHADGVRPPVCCNPHSLRIAIDNGLSLAAGLPVVDSGGWGRAAYHPTPTIVEAACALFANHRVEDISRSDASAENLTVTSKRVEDVIEQASRKHEKAIVFVTGVPGAGKTLVGLNVATRRRDDTSPLHAVFLSGNGPLVAVLQEALVRDEMSRQRGRGKKVRKGAVRQRVKPFIQLVHHFRDAGLQDEVAAPHDHVVIFDEAQRAWNAAETASFMKRKKSRPGFVESEPYLLIEQMDRHEDWAVVVCLVGGGQEINRGEAGISEWLSAVERRFPHWNLYISSRLTDSEYSAAEKVTELADSGRATLDDSLHLAVSMRSFRSERVSEFVKAVLDCDSDHASHLIGEIIQQYPIAVTQDLDRAKRWIRDKARGNERYGLVASSGGQRLKPHAVDVRVKIDPVTWFLNDRTDTRSSWYLEDAATEFQIQGLELDWTCMTWDADLRYQGRSWKFHNFRGSSWENVRQGVRQRYLVNAYRVLLTRARQGMVIFVPPGDSSDPTRAPAFYDGTYKYLTSLGVPEL